MTTTANTATGQVIAVAQIPIGSTLAADAAAGDTVITVDDTADFDEGGGTLGINGATATYTAIDTDADTITLSAGLAAAAAEGDPVTVWDTARNTGCTELVAMVAVWGSDNNSDPVMAVVPHTLADRVPEGIRDGSPESVTLELSNGTWYVTDVIGLQPVIDGAVIGPESIPASAVAFTVTAIGGITTTIGTPRPAAGSNTGDIFIDSTTGQMSRWSGTEWTAITMDASAVLQAGTIEADLIAAGAIGAAQIAAGIVIAGIVNGTMLEGVTLTASGGGSLSAQMTANSLQFNGVGSRSVTFLQALAAANNASRPQATLSGPTDNDALAQILFTGESQDGTSAPALIVQGFTLSGSVAQAVPVQVNGTLVATRPGSVSGSAPSGTPESWRNITPLNGWTLGSGGYFQYKLYPDGTVGLRANNLVPGTTTAGTQIGVVPAGYIPANDRQPVNAWCNYTTSPTSIPTTSPAEVQVRSTTGQILIYGATGGTLSNITIGGRYPLD